MTSFERRWCRALLNACIPGPDGLHSIDLATFWPRFQASAPSHLRLALRLATWVFTLGPLLLLKRPLPSLPEAQRDAALRRMAHWPGVGELTEVAKVVACFAYFQDPAVQARVR